MKHTHAQARTHTHTPLHTDILAHWHRHRIVPIKGNEQMKSHEWSGFERSRVSSDSDGGKREAEGNEIAQALTWENIGHIQ